MAVIAIPTKFGFSRVEKWGLRRAGVALRSRFTGASQRIVFPFAVWEFSGKFIDYPQGQGAEDLRAFLIQLRGIENTFNMPVPGYTQPANYTGLGLSTTVAAASRASSITVTNRGASYIKRGEYFTIQGELKMVTADLTGGGVLAFEPPLRAAAGIGVALTLVNPYVAMVATDETVGIWGIDAPVKHNFDLDAVEAF